MEAFCIFSYYLIIICTFTHWFLYSKNYKLPIYCVIFYAVEVLSNILLIIKPSEKTMWADFSVMGYKFTANSMFYSNVDPYIGLLFFCCHYYFQIKNKIVKYISITIGIMMMLILFNFEMVFQLVYSFSIYSALLTFIFALIVGEQIHNHIFNYFKDDQLEIDQKADLIEE